MFFFFSSRRRHTRYWRDWSSDVCSSDPLAAPAQAQVKSVEIIAPAGPGGGYDQLARATQQVLESQGLASGVQVVNRSEEHTSELQSRQYLVCRLLLEKKKTTNTHTYHIVVC